MRENLPVTQRELELEDGATLMSTTDTHSHLDAAINQLDQTTQQNAALVEQSAAAATGLRSQASRLAEAVEAFRG